MKKLFFGWAALAALFLCRSGRAAVQAFPIVGGNVAASSTVSLKTDGFNWASAQLLVTSVTVPALTFTDGSQSTATITVTSAPIGGFVYPGQICIAGICATYQIGLSPTATGQYTYPYDANGISSNTAQGICNWILGNQQLQSIVTCHAPSGQNVIYATSTISGIASNFPVFSSSATQVGFGVGKIGVGFMTGGTNSAYAQGSQTILIPNQNYATGLGVYLSSSSPTQPIYYSTASVGGTRTALQTGTTFYVIVKDASDIGLATTQTNAVAAQYLTFISSNGSTTADTFTLNVPVIAGTPVTKYSVSNDNVNWTPFVTTSLGQTITVPLLLGTYYSTGTLTWSDLGHIDASWIGLNVTAPTSGEINIQSWINGSKN